MVYFSASMFPAFSCGPLTKLVMDIRNDRFMATSFTLAAEIGEARMIKACNEKYYTDWGSDGNNEGACNDGWNDTSRNDFVYIVYRRACIHHQFNPSLHARYHEWTDPVLWMRLKCTMIWLSSLSRNVHILENGILDMMRILVLVATLTLILFPCISSMVSTIALRYSNITQWRSTAACEDTSW